MLTAGGCGCGRPGMPLNAFCPYGKGAGTGAAGTGGGGCIAGKQHHSIQAGAHSCGHGASQYRGSVGM